MAPSVARKSSQNWLSMTRRSIGALFSVLGLLQFPFGASLSSTTDCKCIPGDPCWPLPSTWAGFNQSLNGRLIATVPLGAPCHDPVYNDAACKSLQQNWQEPVTQRVQVFTYCSVSVNAYTVLVTSHLLRSWHLSSPIEAVTPSRPNLRLVRWGTTSTMQLMSPSQPTSPRP